MVAAVVGVDGGALVMLDDWVVDVVSLATVVLVVVVDSSVRAGVVTGPLSPSSLVQAARATPKARSAMSRRMPLGDERFAGDIPSPYY